MLARKLIGKLGVHAGLGRHLVLGDGQVASDSIDGTRLELHECGVVITNGLELREFRGEVGLIALEHFLGGGIGLSDDVFARKIVKALDARARFHNNNLGIQHVRIGEGVVVFTAFHGEAIPNAVDSARIEQRVFRVPIDSLELNVPAIAIGDLGSEVEVKAGVVAVVTDKAIRRIGLVKAHDELGGIGIRRIFGGVVRTAAGEHAASKRERCGGCRDKGPFLLHMKYLFDNLSFATACCRRPSFWQRGDCPWSTLAC